MRTKRPSSSSAKTAYSIPGQTTSKGDRTQPVRTTRRETHRLQESGRVANVRRPRYKSPDLSLSPTRHGNGQSSVWRCNTLHGHAALLLVQANHKEQRRDKSSYAARRCVTERLSPQSGRWLSPPISRAARAKRAICGLRPSCGPIRPLMMERLRLLRCAHKEGLITTEDYRLHKFRALNSGAKRPIEGRDSPPPLAPPGCSSRQMATPVPVAMDPERQFILLVARHLSRVVELLELNLGAPQHEHHNAHSPEQDTSGTTQSPPVDMTCAVTVRHKVQQQGIGAASRTVNAVGGDGGAGDPSQAAAPGPKGAVERRPQRVFAFDRQGRSTARIEGRSPLALRMDPLQVDVRDLMREEAHRHDATRRRPADAQHPERRSIQPTPAAGNKPACRGLGTEASPAVGLARRRPARDGKLPRRAIGAVFGSAASGVAPNPRPAQRRPPKQNWR